MQNSKKLFILLICCVIAVSSLIGFAIAYTDSTYIAVSRFLIDIGLVVAVAFITIAFINPNQPEEIDQMLLDLKELKNDPSKQGLNVEKFEELSSLAQAFNEVYKEMPVKMTNSVDINNKIKPKYDNCDDHSIHPELGRITKLKHLSQSVVPLIEDSLGDSGNINGQKNQDLHKQTMLKNHSSISANNQLVINSSCTNISQACDKSILQETLRKISHRDMSCKSDDPKTLFPPLSLLTQKKITAPKPSSEEIQILFEQYNNALKPYNKVSRIDSFTKTILDSCDQLLDYHRCKAVRFEVISQSNKVALRPRIIN